ncbi:MAG: ABC transporter substrate-binding protein [Firmicutes bacterium]|jgi:peptide/nickel transport system substrate-binding protein|nr:ABC transporter substrate-binding protein [Bacillota bacterium]
MKRLTKLVLAALVISLMMVGTVFAYQQAPMLDNMDLPPIEERLPENPMVLPVFEAIGQYGGTLRMSMKDPFSTGAVHSGFFSEPLVKWDPTGTGFEANLAEKWEVSEDGLVYRFYLRKGVKWSDGVPLTTEDIEFWYYDNLLNTDLTPAFPVWLSSGGEPVELHIIDDYTFEFRLKEPNAVFIDNLAFQAGGAAFHSIMTVPKHYLKNFHPDYVDPDELLAKAQADGFDTWYDYYYEKRDFRINPDIPVLTAWKPESGLVGREIQYWTRNPYYWKVDEAGNQLPYIDRVAVRIVGEREILNMMIANGEIDLDFANMTLPDYPFLKEHEESGGYRVLLWKSAFGSQLQLFPNLFHQDPVMRELFNNRDFRIALSLAINREEINEFCFLGLATPRAAVISNVSPYLRPGLDQLYAEYDPAKANAMLDELGLDKRNAAGIRLRPDGKPLQFVIEYPMTSEFGPYDDIIDFVAGYWRDLGIDVAVKPLGISIHFDRSYTTEMDFTVWADGRGLHPFIQPSYVFPAEPGRSNGALEYARWWNTGGKEGIKPEGDILRMMELYQEFVKEPDPDVRLEIGRDLIELSARTILGIGTVGLAPIPVVAKDNLRNVPEDATRDWVLVMIGHLRPEQYFFAQ